MFWVDKIQWRTVLKLPPCSLGFLKTHINTTHPCVIWVTKWGQTVPLPCRDRLPRRKITLRLVESSLNVIGFIFVSGEPYLNEFVTRELFPISFSCVDFAFFQCSYHQGFFILGTEGEALQERKTKWCWRAPVSVVREFGFRYLCSALFCCPGVRTRLGGLQA